MKKLLLLLSIILSLSARAQYVTIPDGNFASWLKNNGYSQCFMNGTNQMDTTCKAVVNAKTIDCKYQNSIIDLTGIQYFDSLDTLVCSNDKLTSFLAFPPNLHYLDCSWNNISVLLGLPAGLQYLDCSLNSLSNFDYLPTNLKSLFCGTNTLYKGLNKGLPVLPVGLQYLGCESNHLVNLPTLPSGLQYLSCSSNQLNSLPVLPAGLSYLDCSFNHQLGSLPDLPAHLYELYCRYDSLTSLPEFPDSLNELYCDNNEHLKCLPELKRVYKLRFDNTSITCLPNYGNVTTSNPLLSSLPLCNSTNNPYGCQIFNSIREVSDIDYTISPNPAGNQLFISATGIQPEWISVYDMNGRKMSEQKYTPQIDIASLSSGIYFIEVKNPERVQNPFGVVGRKRFVKM